MVNLEMIGAMALPNLGGWIGTYAVRNSITTWYESLRKPSWHPPKWSVWPTWTSLYSSMGFASYLVWRDGGGFEGRAKYPLMLYGAQLALNWTFLPVFYGMHRMGTGLINIGLLYGTLIATAFAFHSVNPTAGLIMIPYLAWMTFAAALYYFIWRENKEDESKIE